MLRRTLVAITVLIAMNISLLYTITVWIPTVLLIQGDVTGHFMTAIIMITAPVVHVIALVDDHFRRLFGSLLLIVIAVVGYFCAIQTEEWAHSGLWTGHDFLSVYVRRLGGFTFPNYGLHF